MLGKTPSWALSDEQLLAAGPSRLRMAWVDTCLKPGPGSRKAGLVEDVECCAYVYDCPLAKIILSNIDDKLHIIIRDHRVITKEEEEKGLATE